MQLTWGHPGLLKFSLSRQANVETPEGMEHRGEAAESIFIFWCKWESVNRFLSPERRWQKKAEDLANHEWGSWGDRELAPPCSILGGFCFFFSGLIKSGCQSGSNAVWVVLMCKPDAIILPSIITAPLSVRWVLGVDSLDDQHISGSSKWFVR